MIKEIRIQNFQSHKNTTVTFSPTQTVIVGSSNSGKSAIIRALEWVRTNRPLGISFIRSGATEPCKVEVDVVKPGGEVVTITRVKSAKVSYYQLNGETYQALKTDVPEKVLEVLSLSDLNVQRQLDQHFLVLDSPGKIAQTINSITKIEEADKIQALLQKKGREEDRNVKFLEQEISNSTGQLGQFRFTTLQLFEENHQKYVQLSSACSDLLGRYEVLSDLIQSMRSTSSELVRLGAKKHDYELVAELSSVYDEVQSRCIGLRTTATALFDVLDRLHTADLNMRALAARKAVLTRATSLSTLFDTLNQHRSELDAKVQVLRSIIERLKTGQQQLAAHRVIVDRWARASVLWSKFTAVDERRTAAVGQRDLLTALLASCRQTQQGLSAYLSRKLAIANETQQIAANLTSCPLCGNDLDEQHRMNVLQHEGK